MNSMLRILIFSAASLFLIGCESYRNTVRNVGSSMGAIQTRDIQQANAYRETLPSQLGLQPHQIRVEAGSGVTHVIISGVTAETERQRIVKQLEAIKNTNPQMGSLQWKFQ